MERAKKREGRFLGGFFMCMFECPLEESVALLQWDPFAVARQLHRYSHCNNA